MTQTLMVWIYRIVAVGWVGVGSYWVLTDLPPHEGDFLPGIEFSIGLYLQVLPGAPNLLSSFFGRRFALLRWGVVVVNAGMTALWVKLFLDFSFLGGPGGWYVAAAGVLTLLSILLARIWGKASQKAKEAG